MYMTLGRARRQAIAWWGSLRPAGRGTLCDPHTCTRSVSTLRIAQRLPFSRLLPLTVLLGTVGIASADSPADSKHARWEQFTGGAGIFANYLRAVLGPRVVQARTEAEPQPDPQPARRQTKEPKTKEEILAAIASLQEQLDRTYLRHQVELADERTKLQNEIEQLKRENEDLRMGYLHLHTQVESAQDDAGVPRRKTAIEMYSDTLDLLSKYNKDYNASDHLPRIVVVGDQSAGKTSVLEMLAQARIFPRGHGEMMTRSPVQVTLSDGPLKRAKFADGAKEYDLSKENDLKQLRNEIKDRMAASIGRGQTVSSQPISLHVQGPGLPRMVMVDLPGIIGHVTAGMAADTKDEIIRMSRKHMANPNAIIVCVQDGSVDAERSNIADLVSSVDPKGQRTVFVMTKVDMAEAQHTNLSRVRSIMEGRLFRMHALGYFAVVTGRGDPQEDIADIKQYEAEYFGRSVFVRDGALKPQQTTTDNLSRAISQEFWKRVRTSVEEQASLIKAELSRRELEWKNKYKGRLMTRDELLQLGKHEILDSIARFNSISPRDWEGLLQEQMWAAISRHLLHDVYLQSAHPPEDFKTQAEVQLSEWAKGDLPVQCVDVTKKLFVAEFEKVVKATNVDMLQDRSGEVFDALKETVIGRCKARHVWPPEIANTLRVIQASSLEDEVVPDKEAWEEAADFMAARLGIYGLELQQAGRDLFGPGTWDQWVHWQTLTKDHMINRGIRQELQSFLNPGTQGPKARLDHDDLVTVRINVKKATALDVTEQQIEKVYEALYEERSVQKSVQSATYCRSLFKAPPEQVAKAPNGLSCQDVALFWRVQEMLKSSSKSLRQQVVSQRGRVEEDAREELEAIGEDDESKRRLLRGERVELAEQIDVARHIVAQLNAFVAQLRATQNAPPGIHL